MALESTARKLAEEPAAPYRTAPHNIEAEQALLGAILVNNEAFYRVSDFLEPEHFFEPIHQQIYDIAAQPDPRRQDRHAGHAEDLPAGRHRHRRADGQPISRPPRRRSDHRHQRRRLRPHDLRPRDPPRADRDRRGHGQHRVRRAGRFRAARADRGRRAQALRARRDRPLWRRLPEVRDGAHHRGRHGGARLPARRQALRARDRPARPRRQDGRPAVVRPDHHRRPPRHGQDRARHQHRLQRRARLARRGAAPTAISTTVNGGIVGFFSLEMSAEQLATRIIAEQTGIPSSTIRRGGITEGDFEKIKDVAIELQHLPLYIDETGGLSIAQLAARARRLKRQQRPRPPGHRLHPAAAGLAARARRKTACRKSPRSPPA